MEGSVSVSLVDNSERKDNVLNMRLIRGGKDDNGDVYPWLLGLDLGTVFLCRPRVKANDLGKERSILLGYILIKKFDRAVLLSDSMTNQYLYVDPIGFSSYMELYEEIGKVPMSEDPTEEKKEEEINNG